MQQRDWSTSKLLCLQNSEQVFEAPFQITTAADLQQVREALLNLEVLELGTPATPQLEVGRRTGDQCNLFRHQATRSSHRERYLPAFLSGREPCLVALDRNSNNGKVYSDNLCFFRALALHNGCHQKNLERDAQHYCERYRKFFPEKNKFCGVKLKELIDLEHLYEVNISVYSLEPTKPDGDEGEEDREKEEEDFAPEIAAQLIHHSLCHYPSTLYLNLYQNHFSYIKDLKKYAKSYSCSRCGTLWKHVGKLNRHERICEAKVSYQFPGGAYKTPPTIFQLLEDEGLTVPEHLKFFPYRATFDFECMFTPETDLNDTEKLTWDAKHISLSVSVCSNVPDYDQPKCFVSDGDSKQLVKEMLEHLVKTSEQSYDLLRKEFNFLFEAIDQRLQDLQQISEPGDPSKTNTVENLTQEDSDDEGEHLMDTDNEEEG